MNFNVVILYNPPSHDTSFYYNLEEMLKFLIVVLKLFYLEILT